MPTLQEMQKRTPFTSWEGYTDEEAIEDSRAVYRETIQSLIELGPEPDRERVLAILGQYVEAFNALDAKYDGYIETIERENICDTVEEMAAACGLQGIRCDDVPGEGRDW